MPSDLKMPEINSVLIAGHATKDVANSTTKGGTAYSKFRIASTRRFKTKDGEKKEDTTYIDVLYYGNNRLISSIKKGDPLYVQGRISQDDWETEAGEKRSKYQIIAGDVQKLSWDEKWEVGSSSDDSVHVTDDLIAYN